MSRQILLFGRNGQLGFELHKLLTPLVHVVGLDIDECDLADPASVRKTIRAIRPSLILNASAYTDVEKAESETEAAMAINAGAPRVMAEMAKALGAGLVHYSTDYVFDGASTVPYEEDDRPNPASAYGRSKLAGEEAIRESQCPHLILRTSWLYGARGKNFLLTILRLARTKERLSIVDNQIGAPTWCRSLAVISVAMLQQLDWKLPPAGGTYHVTSSGATSWCGFARTALGMCSDARLRSVEVSPIPTSEYPTKARRPLNSRLSTSKLQREFGLVPQSWQAGLREVIREIEADIARRA